MLYFRTNCLTSACLGRLRLGLLRTVSTSRSTSIESPHSTPLADPLDSHILDSIRDLLAIRPRPPNLYEMYDQYRCHSDRILDDRILVTEEHPATLRMSHLVDHSMSVASPTGEEGDGTVLVVHALLSSGTADQKVEIEKISICSGFVLNVRPSTVGKQTGEREPDDTDQEAYIMTCAHTLEEMYRHLPKPDQTIEPPRSLSFILTSTGLPVLLQSCLSSIPRSDLSLFLARHSPGKTNLLGKKLKSLPITPYPVPAGHKVGVHLFSGLNDGEPVVKLNKRHSLVDGDNQGTERMQRTSSWIGGRAYKRWGVGEMLGYRSFTGQEVEAGSSHTLPHLQTSPLPTSGSSGGPIIRLDTGTVVGLISGRRMDNRVEGERGWGAAAEGMFEMFGLPGFVPASKRKITPEQ